MFELQRGTHALRVLLSTSSLSIFFMYVVQIPPNWTYFAVLESLFVTALHWTSVTDL